jgi:PAS domain S-box-containing protein
VTRGLVGALAADTVAATVAGLARRAGHPAGALAGLEVGNRLLWVGLLVALLWRLEVRIGRLRRLLAARDGHLADMAATSHGWFWEADTELVVTSCSPAVTSLLGVAVAEVVGRPMYDLVQEGDLDRARAVVAQARQNGTGWKDVELSWRHADGGVVPLRGSAVAVCDRRGRIVGFRGTNSVGPGDPVAAVRLDVIRCRTAEVIRQDSIRVALQPIISLITGEWVGAEALARFPDDRSPDVWFKEAHEAGMGIELELAAARAAVAALEHLPSRATLSVNASPLLVLDARFADMLHDAGAPLDRVVVEITEHTEVAHYDALRAALRPLRESGLQVAVDDAGAGYASFNHVLRLRPDIIKLDRCLLADIDTDQACRTLVTAIVLLALDLGASVTAEGVETRAELDSVTDLGVDHAQGFVLADPSTDPGVWRTWSGRDWNVTPRSPCLHARSQRRQPATTEPAEL